MSVSSCQPVQKLFRLQADLEMDQPWTCHPWSHTISAAGYKKKLDLKGTRGQPYPDSRIIGPDRLDLTDSNKKCRQHCQQKNMLHILHLVKKHDTSELICLDIRSEFGPSLGCKEPIGPLRHTHTHRFLLSGSPPLSRCDRGFVRPRLEPGAL